MILFAVNDNGFPSVFIDEETISSARWPSILLKAANEDEDIDPEPPDAA